MPTYDYVCNACGHRMELVQSMTEAPKRKCPACGKSRLERLIGMGAGLIFKGSGFYQTDYRSKSYSESAKADQEPAKAGEGQAAKSAEKVDQEVFFVEKADKRALLVEVLRDPSMTRVLVFSRTKHGANRIAEHLSKARVTAEAIHGNKSQNARERALSGFKTGRLRVLVATDIAARGIDVDNVTHVVNFDVPEVPETYVHRIGRTARAGATGMALTFVEVEERADWKNILKLTRQDIPIVEGHPYESRVPFSVTPPSQGPTRAPRPHNSQGHRRGRNRRRR